MANADANPIQVQKYLSGVDYPCDKSDLVEHARSEDAPREVIEALDGIRAGTYETPADVSEQLGS